MPLFKKKPVVIAAVRYTGWNYWEILAWAHHGLPLEANSIITHDDFGVGMAVRTLEGRMTVSPGDWVVRGVAGEFYPCKPDIFEATYEAVDEAQRQRSGAAPQRRAR